MWIEVSAGGLIVHGNRDLKIRSENLKAIVGVTETIESHLLNFVEMESREIEFCVAQRVNFIGIAEKVSSGPLSCNKSFVSPQNDLHICIYIY